MGRVALIKRVNSRTGGVNLTETTSVMQGLIFGEAMRRGKKDVDVG